jgi:HlyD family secretion protein
VSRSKVWILIAVVLVSFAGFWFVRGRGSKAESWRTMPAERGPIAMTVSATGTIEPVTKVAVGSQVSGTIATLGADYNDRVRKGQVIAQLDPSLFRTAAAQSEANLARAQAAYANAKRTFERSKALAERGVLAQVDLDAAQASYEQTAAEVKQAQAALSNARVNLAHATILSPIDGVVIARSVDIGQTVAASLQAPELFQIAGDLTRMQVETRIDEADIGRVTPGLKATFTVDAFPEATFEGTVRQVRLEPVVEQNVVTYTTVIDVPNPELKLKPGMTANVTIGIDHRDDVLRIANAALRFHPPVDPKAARGGGQGGGGPLRQAEAGGGAMAAEGRRMRGPAGAGGPGAPGMGGAGGRMGGNRGNDAASQTVYVLGADGKLQPVRVQTGITDGTFTEVVSGGLAAGAAVVVGAMPRNPQTMSAPPPGMGGGPRMGGGGGSGGGRR